MKLTTFILMMALAQVSAMGFGQTITLNEKNTPIEKVLLKIRQQSGYEFIYDVKDLKGQKVSLKLTNASIEEAVKSSLENLPLTFTILDKNIVLKKKEPSFIDNIIARFQSIDVRGKVMDEQNQPLPGATISVKGKSQQVKSDVQGNFYLPNVDEKATLLISYVGFKTMEVAVKDDLGVLSLKPEDNSLDQVQVIAYGEQIKKFSTSNIGTVSGEVISRQPVTNPLIAIQGRIPGLFIRQTNGLNTGAININVQGKNSLNLNASNANQPFYVVDGVPFNPVALTYGGNLTGSNATGLISNLNFINPNEIESITVLKDADATAIYGSRAANGAILITTKKGKAGQTKVDLNLQTGWGKVANKLKVLNTEQYIALKKEAYANNNNQPVPPSAVDINGTWDPKRNINWQDELIGGTAQFQNLQASISGGSERTQFLAGASYIRETPVFHGDFSDVKTAVNFNINHASNDEKFRFFLSGSYLEGNNRMPLEDVTGRAITLAPNFPDLYNPDGTVNWAAVPGVYPYQSTTNQPAATLLNQYNNKASNLIANSAISYQIIPGLTIKSTFGYNSLQNDEQALSPSATLPPEFRAFNIKPFAKFSDKGVKSWIIEPQATYTRSFSFGTIDALLGSTFQTSESNLLALYGEEYNNDAQLSDFNSAGIKSTLGSIQSQYKYSAIFGRLNYRIQDKYILNLAVRRDGSSRFGSENLFHNFYSIGGAWLFSEEGIVKKALPFMNYGKLRATYGTTGSDQIADYLFYSLYNTVPTGVPYLGVSALTPAGLPNPYLQWEETHKLNLGADFGFFDSRVLVTANYFRNRSSNQLLFQNLSAVTGFSVISRNLPALVQNTGWEFSLQYQPIRGKDFSWQGSFNITLPKNKLVRYDGLENSNDANRFVIGESITLVKGYSFQGVDPQTGLYQFKTLKGEMTSAPVNNIDNYINITTDPKYYGGFSNTFTYKGFSLDVFFNFVSQMGTNLKFQAMPAASFNTNYLAYVEDRWRKPGDIASIQKISSNFGPLFGPYNSAVQSDGAYQRITYARLNNAMLSYNFNNELTKRVRIANARLFIQGQNLFTISNFDNGDPEVQSSTNMGLLRRFSLGTQLTF